MEYIYDKVWPRRAPRARQRVHLSVKWPAARAPRSSQAAVVSSPGRTGSPAPPSRIVGVLLSGRRALALRPRQADRDPDHPEQHGGGELRVAAHQPRQARRCQRSAPPQGARGAAPPANRRRRGRRSGFWGSSGGALPRDRWPGAPGTLSPQICAHSFLELASDTFHLISPWFESSPLPPRSTSFLIFGGPTAGRPGTLSPLSLCEFLF